MLVILALYGHKIRVTNYLTIIMLLIFIFILYILIMVSVIIVIYNILWSSPKCKNELLLSNLSPLIFKVIFKSDKFNQFLNECSDYESYNGNPNQSHTRIIRINKFINRTLRSIIRKILKIFVLQKDTSIDSHNYTISNYHCNILEEVSIRSHPNK